MWEDRRRRVIGVGRGWEERSCCHFPIGLRGRGGQSVIWRVLVWARVGGLVGPVALIALGGTKFGHAFRRVVRGGGMV